MPGRKMSNIIVPTISIIVGTNHPMTSILDHSNFEFKSIKYGNKERTTKEPKELHP